MIAAGVARPRSRDEIGVLIAGSGKHRIARGLGRSYGDAAQCAGGLVIDCTQLNEVLEIDEQAGRLRAEAGVSFDKLLRDLVPRGFFLPVSPGTRFVTLGGAIASDVHGKNHHVDGSLSAHVDQLLMAPPVGPITCGPSDNSEEFWATCGGMGLTGVITEATIRLLPIETSKMVVDTERVEDLDSCLSMLANEHGRYRYSVAWIDALARGGKLGRGVVSRGDHARLSDLPTGANGQPLAYDPHQLLSVPFAPPRSLLTSMSVGAFNEFWFRKARPGTGRLASITGFFHPLDALGRWNLLYGRRGFTQYQFVVPFGAEETLRAVLEQLSSARVASFLSVLKCFGPAGSGHLSFPDEGWTLALDLPLGTPGLVELLDTLDEEVASAGGRIYLSKDGRVRPDLLGAMYPRLEQWRGIRRRLDPDGVLGSDLASRLGLCAGRVPPVQVAAT